MLGYAPGDCVVFEDSMTGVQAAQDAGAKVVGVATTLSAFPDIDLTIRDFLDPRLEQWLQQLSVAQ
jgi:beta-phosphoglucomutase-like phosphatase (HAD superfamily)